MEKNINGMQVYLDNVNKCQSSSSLEDFRKMYLDNNDRIRDFKYHVLTSGGPFIMRKPPTLIQNFREQLKLIFISELLPDQVS